MQRFFYFLSILILLTLLSSCKDGDKTSTVSAPTPVTSANPTPLSTSSSGVEHYSCPNGHIGFGSDAAGTCSQCGSTLQHNADFHDTPPPQDLVDQSNNVAAQNETNTGVEHYTCPNGHVGNGGGVAGTCSQCGSELVHNAAFHNASESTDLASQTNNSSTVPSTQAPEGVEHYTCPNGHVGSGGASEGTCSQCQAVLVHNDAFHANDPINNAPSTPINSGEIISQPSGAVSPIFQNAGGIPTVGNTPKLEPSQNTFGVWHYICEDGHAGGAGSASACSVCGKTLVHNAGYH